MLRMNASNKKTAVTTATKVVYRRKRQPGAVAESQSGRPWWDARENVERNPEPRAGSWRSDSGELDTTPDWARDHRVPREYWLLPVVGITVLVWVRLLLAAFEWIPLF